VQVVILSHHTLFLVSQVMQIFYPYSMQVYPNEFPGEDPKDCPRNVNPDQLVLLISDVLQ